MAPSHAWLKVLSIVQSAPLDPEFIFEKLPSWIYTPPASEIQVAKLLTMVTPFASALVVDSLGMATAAKIPMITITKTN